LVQSMVAPTLFTTQKPDEDPFEVGEDPGIRTDPLPDKFQPVPPEEKSSE